MQSVTSRIWTRIVVSNSYDDKHYTTGTSKTENYDLMATLLSTNLIKDLRE